MARLHAHAGLRAEVQAATSLGLSLRRWCGWEPREVHTPQPDGAVLVTREPEWDQDSRDWVLALRQWEDSHCPQCNGWLPETTNPANEDAYEATDPGRCHRCTALVAKQHAYAEHPYRQSQVLWPVTLRRSGG